MSALRVIATCGGCSFRDGGLCDHHDATLPSHIEGGLPSTSARVKRDQPPPSWCPLPTVDLAAARAEGAAAERIFAHANKLRAFYERHSEEEPSSVMIGAAGGLDRLVAMLRERANDCCGDTELFAAADAIERGGR